MDAPASLGCTTWERNKTWESEGTIVVHNVAQKPMNPMSLYGLGWLHTYDRNMSKAEYLYSRSVKSNHEYGFTILALMPSL